MIAAVGKWSWVQSSSRQSQIWTLYPTDDARPANGRASAPAPNKYMDGAGHIH